MTAAEPSPTPPLPWRLILLVAWAACSLWVVHLGTGFLDTPRLNDNNLALLQVPVLGLDGQVAALFQPASHVLVSFLAAGSVLALAMPWILGGAAALLCLWCASRGWVVPTFGFGMLALLSTPYAVLLAVLVPLASTRGRGHRWSLTLAVGVPAALVLVQLVTCMALPAERVWRRAGDEPLAQVFLAAHLDQDGDFQRRQEARNLLERATPELAPSLLKLRAMERLVHLRFAADDGQGASEMAEAACGLADRLDTRRIHHYLLAARCLFHENDDRRALEWVQKVEALVPDHPDVLAYEAERLLRDGADEKKGAQADELIARALKKDPRNFRARLAMGRWAEARGDLLSAMRSYRDAMKIQPKDPEPHLLLVNLYLQQDMVPAAHQAVRVAMGKGHDIRDPRLEYCLGLIYFLEGHQDDARKRLEQVLQLQPGNLDVRRILSKVLAAQALSRVGQVKPHTLAAIAKRICELDPQNPQGLVVMAVVKAGEKDFRAATVLLEAARRNLPEDQDVLRRLAAAYRQHGWQLYLQKKPEPAMDEFRRFLDLAPEGMDTTAVRDAVDSHCKRLERRGWEQLAKDHLEAAEATYQRSVQLLPERPEAHHSLAAAKLARKEFDAALREAKEAERLAKKQRRAYGLYRLLQVDILKHMGKGEEARQLAKEFLEDPGAEAPEVIAAMRKLIHD